MNVSQFRGALLEEAVAYLMQHSGVAVISEAAHDPEDLEESNGTLYVKGRGGRHQADVLAELLIPPPFSPPLRLVVEAKSWSRRVGLNTVRSVKGLLDDVNDYHRDFDNPLSTHPRYVAVVASTSGFSPGAVRFAFAHHISTIDLTHPWFQKLRSATEDAAKRLEQVVARQQQVKMADLRRRFREMLYQQWTGWDQYNEAGIAQDVDSIIVDFASSLRAYGTSILIGFTRTGLLLPLVSQQHQLPEVLGAHRAINVGFRLEAGSGENGHRGYQLVQRGDIELPPILVAVPPTIMEWIAKADTSERVGLKQRQLKESMSSITVYLWSGTTITTTTLIYQRSESRRVAAERAGQEYP